jgi:hypothetical protein
MVRTHLRASPEAEKYDLVDLVDVLSGHGCRIGKPLALGWTKVDAGRRPDERSCHHRSFGPACDRLGGTRLVAVDRGELTTCSTWLVARGQIFCGRGGSPSGTADHHAG